MKFFGLPAALKKANKIGEGIEKEETDFAAEVKGIVS